MRVLLAGLVVVVLAVRAAPIQKAPATERVDRIKAMFGIVKEVLDKTVVDFEAALKKHMKEDAYVKLVVKMGVEVLAELGHPTTEDNLRRFLLSGFMGSLDQELKAFAEKLREDMQNDHFTQGVAELLKKHAPKKEKREVNLRDYINAKTVRTIILAKLGELEFRVFKNMAKTAIAEIEKMKETHQDLYKLIGKKIGAGAHEVEGVIKRRIEQDFENSQYLFGQLFINNFTNNKKVAKLVGEIVEACLKEPLVIKFVKPRAQLLELLGRVLDSSVEELKKDVEEYDRTNAKAVEAYTWLAKELTAEGKKTSVEEVRQKALAKMDKLFMKAVGAFKESFAEGFMRPDNRPVGGIMMLLQLADQEDASKKSSDEEKSDEEDTIVDLTPAQVSLLETLEKVEGFRKFREYVGAFGGTLHGVPQGYQLMVEVYVEAAMQDDLVQFAIGKIAKYKKTSEKAVAEMFRSFLWKELQEARDHFVESFKKELLKDPAFWKFLAKVNKGVQAIRKFPSYKPQAA